MWMKCCERSHQKSDKSSLKNKASITHVQQKLKGIGFKLPITTNMSIFKYRNKQYTSNSKNILHSRITYRVTNKVLKCTGLQTHLCLKSSTLFGISRNFFAKNNLERLYNFRSHLWIRVLLFSVDIRQLNFEVEDRRVLFEKYWRNLFMK